MTSPADPTRTSIARVRVVRSAKPLANTELAVQLAAHRQKLGLTVREAAEQVGVHYSVYFRAETKSDALPAVPMFLALCRWLGVRRLENAAALACFRRPDGR